MKKVKAIFVLCLALGLSAAVSNAQSRGFKLGQWSEIHNSIVRQLSLSYVDSLDVDRMMRAGIDAMLAQLDPYTIYVPEEENEDFQRLLSNTYGGIGAVVHKEKGGYVIINEPYEGSPSAKNGLQCGDEILEIDGVDPRPLEIGEATDRMKGKPGTKVRFKVRKVRSGEVVDVDVVRERIQIPSVDYVGMLDSETGYIRQTKFTENVSSEIRSAYYELKSRGMTRLILDLRGNGGGLMDEAVDIVSLFVPKGSLVVTSKGMSEQAREMRTRTEPVDVDIPLYIMIDSNSASSSEIVSGALQDMDRATILGQRSYGKGLVQSIRPVAYNGQLKVTTAKYYTPSGRCVQAIDYTHRNEDGSVGHIPDSLTHEFKTAKGRTVRDGGGITPDVEIKSPSYSRIVYALVLYGIVDRYAIEYARKHGSIPPVEDFHLSDQDFEDFVSFAGTREFDYRSTAKASFDQMKNEMEKDGLAGEVKEQLDLIEKTLQIEKEQFIRLKKDEIVPFIEEEIAVRYYFQKAGVQIRLRYDSEVREVLDYIHNQPQE
ncbi:MAG: S41 family peptidase [Candidatus Cryptobacteroides sp.]